MRKLLFFAFLFSLSVTYAQVVPHDLLPAKPANARPVVDDAGILTDAEESQLVRKLVDYNNSTSNQIVIVTVKTLHGYGSDQYSAEIGHYWGVGGQADKDNGVVILVSTGTEESGKRKVFISPGYGLEGALPAITCKKITDNEMVPSLRAGNYYEAFDKAIDAIIKAAAGEYTAPEGYAKKERSGRGIGGGILGFIVIMVVVLILISRGGGGGGRMMGRRGIGDVAEIMLLSSLLGGRGGGGGGGGGGSDGGGFGSFGGGDFGGGGSGSDW